MADEFLSYEQVPYPGRLHPQTHPGHVAVIATLFGLSPAPPERCRVLELGCADGANLIAMADGLPGSTFVGVDGSPTQIAAGQRVISELGYPNVSLRAADLRTLDEGLGQFDYIIVHGVFSWVAEDARQAILRLCRSCLAPDGVAYISYNTLPGWHSDQMLRGIVRFHTAGIDSAAEQIDQAQAILSFVSAAALRPEAPWGRFLQAGAARLLEASPDYLFHEYLEENNRPLYLHQFVSAAQGHGLQYLGDAVFHLMMAHDCTAEAKQTLDTLGRNQLEMEQYLDFLRNTRFRRTLLCHRERPLERAVALDRLVALRIASPLTPDPSDPGRFVLPSAEATEVTTEDPRQQEALRWLHARWPRAVPFREIAAALGAPSSEQYTALAELFMTLYTRGLIEVLAFQAPLSTDVGERPRASRLARYQAVRGAQVASQRFARVELPDLQSREILARLDGTRTVDDLIDELLPLLSDDSRAALPDPRAALSESVRQILARLAREGLLLPD